MSMPTEGPAPCRGAIPRRALPRRGGAGDLFFNTELPPDTFVFQPPEGEEIRPIELGEPQFHWSVAEVDSAAPFTVFILPELPRDWELDAFFSPAQQRPKVPPAASVFYRSRDGSTSLTVSQCAASEGDFESLLGSGPALELIERGEFSMQVRGRTTEWPQTVVQLVRAGTDITLVPDNLDRDAVADLAARLVPARTRLKPN